MAVLSFRKFSHETIRKSSRVIMRDYSWQCPKGKYWNGNGAVWLVVSGPLNLDMYCSIYGVDEPIFDQCIWVGQHPADYRLNVDWGCVPLGWSRSRSVIQDLFRSGCIKGTGEFMTRVDSPVPLMHHDPDRSWITDLDLDHPKGTQPRSTFSR